ncbi:hypothetical protein ABW20_dc0105263 [Dactylellina cionopaga]|nr:hypothetical protein ABW20_dc0105263 [Dactylellina cionopaga]
MFPFSESNQKPDPAIYSISEQVSRVDLGGRYDNSNPRGSYRTAASTLYETQAAESQKLATVESGAISNEANFVAPKQCSSCEYQISKDKPTFQCLSCIDYEICGGCYLEMLASPSGVARNHSNNLQNENNHRFEGIPPLNHQWREYQGRRRKLHWEPMISPDGRVSELCFDFIDALIDYWTEHLCPGLSNKDGVISLSPEAVRTISSFGAELGTRDAEMVLGDEKAKRKPNLNTLLNDMAAPPGGSSRVLKENTNVMV